MLEWARIVLVVVDDTRVPAATITSSTTTLVTARAQRVEAQFGHVATRAVVRGVQ